jgi:hypothetical protein
LLVLGDKLFDDQKDGKADLEIRLINIVLLVGEEPALPKILVVVDSQKYRIWKINYFATRWYVLRQIVVIRLGPAICFGEVDWANLRTNDSAPERMPDAIHIMMHRVADCRNEWTLSNVERRNT